MWRNVFHLNDPMVVDLHSHKESELLAYWSMLAVEEGLPHRLNFQASKIQTLLPEVALVRVDGSEGQQRFSVEHMGSTLQSIVRTMDDGVDVNRILEDEEIRQRMLMACETKRPYYFEAEMPTKLSAEFSSLCIPLANDDGEVCALMFYFNLNKRCKKMTIAA